jgi:hypothetical protein
MRPTGTEKVGFSKNMKKQQHNQTQNHQKNNPTGRITKKIQKTKLNQTWMFLTF